MKYKIRKDLKLELSNKTLYRIEALKSFYNVKEGDLGGYIESEHNLSQNGDCWIYDNACVYDNARVHGNAQVCANAQVHDNARVSGDARVYDRARVYNSMNISSSKDLIYISGLNFNISLSLTGINIGCKHYKDLNDFMSRVDTEANENGYIEIDKKHLIATITMNINFLNEIKG